MVEGAFSGGLENQLRKKDAADPVAMSASPYQVLYGSDVTPRYDPGNVDRLIT